MSKQNDLIVDGINISSLRLHLEIGRKCTISTEEWLKVLDILEKLHQENKHLEDIIQKSAERFTTDYFGTFKQNKELQQENDELKVVNLRLLQRLEVEDEDVNSVYQLEKELDNKKSEWYTAIKKIAEYEQILDEIKQDISEYIKTPDFFELLDSSPIITHDEYIAICTRHNLASEINSIVKKYG